MGLGVGWPASYRGEEVGSSDGSSLGPAEGLQVGEPAT